MANKIVSPRDTIENSLFTLVFTLTKENRAFSFITLFLIFIDFLQLASFAISSDFDLPEGIKQVATIITWTRFTKEPIGGEGAILYNIIGSLIIVWLVFILLSIAMIRLYGDSEFPLFLINILRISATFFATAFFIPLLTCMVKYPMMMDLTTGPIVLTIFSYITSILFTALAFLFTATFTAYDFNSNPLARPHSRVDLILLCLKLVLTLITGFVVNRTIQHIIIIVVLFLMVVALARFQAYYRSWIAVLRSALFGFGLGLAICSFLADHFFGSLSQWIQVLLFVLLACISSAVCGLITWGLRNELRVVYRRDREKKRMQREEKQKEKEKPENMVKERKGRHGKYMASNDGSARKDSGRSHHSTNSSARDVPPSMPQTQALIGGMSNVMIAQSGDADQMIQSTIDFADVESVGDDDLLGSHSDSDLRKLRGSGRRDSHSEHAQPEARHEERSSTWSLPHSSDEDNPGSKPKKGRIAEVKSGRRSSESSDSTKGSQSHPGAHIQGEDSDLVEHSPSTSEHTHDPDSISHGHSESIGSDADDPGSFHSVSDDHGVLISPKMVAGVNVHDDKGSAMHGDDLENTATSKIDKYDGEEEEEEEEEEDSKSSSSNLYGEVGRGMNTGDADSYDGYGYDEYSNNNEGKEEDWRNLSPSPSKVVNSVSTASGLCLAGISVLNLRVEHKMKEVLSEDGLDNRGDLLSPANQSRVQGMSRYGSLQEVNGQSTTKVNSSLNSPQHSLSEQSASSKNSKKSLVAKREIVHDVAGSESIYNSALASKFKDNYWVLLHQASLLMFSNQLMRSYFIVTKAQKQYDIARSKRWTKADVLTGKKSEERDRKTGRLVKRSGSF
ncbi:hypothetical protein ADUPG1_011805, partial [Aduncisulcus paluster]